MRKSAFVLSALLFGASLTTTSAFADNLVGNQAVLRALDKVTATTQDYTVNVGETLKYGSLEIAVKHCEKRPPEETPETYVFLQISDTRLNGSGEKAENEKLFSGWMFASSPALSSLEHAVYDIWVIECKVPNVEPMDLDGGEN
ncbi:MAG: glycosyl hydrolase family 5 [Robiginitomaculum sp.]|nr:MAG: glycosyl hydrolase family 5 [Robiginitomaculum sp.]